MIENFYQSSILVSEDVSLLLYKFPVVNIVEWTQVTDYMGPGVVVPTYNSTTCKTEENTKFQTSLSYMHQNCKAWGCCCSLPGRL